jgi:3-methyladenine DNA glycosylase AlkD
VGRLRCKPLSLRFAKVSILNASELQKKIRHFANPSKAKILQGFFKTGPGQYAEGDIFLGVNVPQTRTLCKEYVDLPKSELQILLKSPYHEDRLAAVLILVQHFERAESIKEKKDITLFYLKNRKYINNWDLVDQSAHKILGAYCFEADQIDMMEKLLTSKHHWSRRIAIVSTLFWIRKNKTELTFRFSKNLLQDPEDLMHKSTGWMLREAGKRHKSELKKFIQLYGHKMPRTMLRYCIEHFPKKAREKILRTTRR